MRPVVSVRIQRLGSYDPRPQCPGTSFDFIRRGAAQHALGGCDGRERPTSSAIFRAPGR